MAPDTDTELLGRRVQTRAYGKLNLRLKVCGRRADGYHLLSMLNTQVSLADEISLLLHAEKGSRVVVHGVPNAEELSDLERNIAARAAQRYLAACGSKLRFTIEISKRIPQGGGMGGGSADAAAVLSMLQSAFEGCGAGLPSSDMAALALSLGADVPYFLQGGLALVSGIGEEVSNVVAPELDGAQVLLFMPEDTSETAQVYAHYRERYPKLARRHDPIQEKLSALPLTEAGTDERYRVIIESIENDFEELLPALLPRVWRAIEIARSDDSLRVGLTGSGSVFFALPRVRNTEIVDNLHSLRTKLAPLGVAVLPSNLRTVRHHL